MYSTKNLYIIFIYKDMVTKNQMDFVRHFFGIFLLFIGLIGIILPIMPGLIFFGIGLTMLQDIIFFKHLKNKIECKIKSVLPTSFKDIKRQKKEILT